MSRIRVDYYSDILCIWAFISQARLRELQAEFSADIEVHCRYLSVFGDVPGKLAQGWAERGGHHGYAEHVQQVAGDFPDIAIHPDVWRSCVPRSSGPAHLWLCAARLLAPDRETRLASALRDAFFRDVQDISETATLREVAIRAGLDATALQAQMDSGAAWATLCGDWNLAREAQIQASPTFVFNQGRQRLTGNVGYRIIQANLRELMDRPEVQHSWC